MHEHGPRRNHGNRFWDGHSRPAYATMASPMNPVLKLLIEGGHLTTAQMAQVAGIPEAEVDRHLEELKKDRVFLGWRPVLDLSRESAAADLRVPGEDWNCIRS